MCYKLKSINYNTIIPIPALLGISSTIIIVLLIRYLYDNTHYKCIDYNNTLQHKINIALHKQVTRDVEDERHSWRRITRYVTRKLSRAATQFERQLNK